MESKPVQNAASTGMKGKVNNPLPVKPQGFQPPPPQIKSVDKLEKPAPTPEVKHEEAFTKEMIPNEKASEIKPPQIEQNAKPAMPVPLPARRQAEEVPFDLIIESDLSLRKRLRWLSK